MVERGTHKRERTQQALARAVARVRVGPKADAARALAEAYFRHVNDVDVAERSVEVLAQLVVEHWRLARLRPVGTAHVVIRHVAGAIGHSVVQIVTDDMPFLVDSVSAELTRLGHPIHVVVHPQLVVPRDRRGRITGPVCELDPGLIAPGVAEAWMHFEIGALADAAVHEEVDGAIRRVLEDVRLVVGDWQAMRTRALEIADGLVADPPPQGVADVDEAHELLQWLADDHFTFLGYADYALAQVRGRPVLRADPSTALGILRHDQAPPLALTARVEAFARDASAIVVTKSTARATVHRPSHLDHIGVKRFDAEGQPVGERRFVGLFTSSVYTERVDRIPMLRRKVRDVLRRSGLPPTGHSGRDLVEILETYPRDELFQMSAVELTEVANGVLGLEERRRLRLFVRHDRLGRFVSCLVYFPRDRYTTDARVRIAHLLREVFDAREIDHTARVSESVLARLHFTLWLRPGARAAAVDVAALEERLSQATRAWVDDLAEALMDRHGETRGSMLLTTYNSAFPEAYKADVAATVAVDDIDRLETGAENTIVVWLSQPHPTRPDERRLKIYRHGPAISLSQILPILERMHIEVVDERPYEVTRHEAPSVWIYDFGVRYATPADLQGEAPRRLVEQAVVAVWNGDAESDGFNALVPLVGCTWREATIMRAYGKYLRQTGSAFSQEYIEDCLVANVPVARLLLKLFTVRFDPAVSDDRIASERQLIMAIRHQFEEVQSLDHDRILRAILGVIVATVRTNYYQRDRDGKPRAVLALKLDPRAIPELPRPRPRHEIWVSSPRVDAVHLRFGPIGRGGLRWSDRREDLRTEVLDLAKTQMIKNAVIVPVGAKGGFVVKQPPAERSAAQAEGVACYRMFISALLDLTDNRVADSIVPPPDVVRHDEDDTYMVVAADKGTATFSDLANAVSAEHGYWLGDAFASGGSTGYDHKAMGITARGAWVSVEFHLRAIGLDPLEDELTVVGVGDMSGDVFGNGLLYSPHLRLLAAFDHRNVFLDPDPQPASAFAERRRLYELPGSSWADYSPKLISRGGGVYPRSAKSIPTGPQVRRALGIPDGIDVMAPQELLKAILCAPVDLLWNGGIGTFVKAADERHVEVGDRANDAIRVNGGDLRCKTVGEGGNLGFTQLGRVEYALGGGLLNTDAVDNSGGVDTSDREVNIKILLDRVVRSGELTVRRRNTLLAKMTDEVASQVLADNANQNVALANNASQSAALLHVHERLMRTLEATGRLDREVERLPSAKGIAERRQAGLGLCAPELAVLLAYAKIVLYDELLASDLPDELYFRDALQEYFPAPLRRRYATAISDHPLRREITATQVANRLVNRAGITFWLRIRDETGASFAEIARAHAASWAIFRMRSLWDAVEALPPSVSGATSMDVRLQGERLVERGARWLIANRWAWRDTESAVALFQQGAGEVIRMFPGALRGLDRTVAEERREAWQGAGVPPAVAERAAVMEAGYAALDVVEVATERGQPVADVCRVHFALADRLGIAHLMERINSLPRDERWGTLARATLREDLFAVHARLTANVIDTTGPAATDDRLDSWWERSAPAVDDAVASLDEIATSATANLAGLSVATRVLRSLVRAVTGAHF